MIEFHFTHQVIILVIRGSRMSKAKIGRLALGAALFVALGGCGKGSLATISLERTTIQAALAPYFPLSSDKLGEGEKKPIRITLSDPDVLLEEGSDRLGMRMKVVVEPTDEKGLVPPFEKLPPGAGPVKDPLEGTLVLHGEIHYKPEEAAFYCRNPTVATLNFPRLPPFPETAVRALAEAVLAKYLPAHPIYTLSDANLKSRAAKSVLKSVAVRNGKLDLEVGW